MTPGWKTTQLMICLIAGLAVSALISCNLLNDRRQHPTVPGSYDSTTAANFFATGSQSSQFEWSPGNEVFCVNLPVPGEYHVAYQTNYGTFHIVLRAEQAARLYIGLHPDDEVSAIELSDGSIPADAPIVAEDSNVLRFATPDDPTPWKDVFTMSTDIPLEKTDTPCVVGGGVISAKNAIAAVQTRTATIPVNRRPRGRSAQQLEQFKEQARQRLKKMLEGKNIPFE